MKILMLVAVLAFVGAVQFSSGEENHVVELHQNPFEGKGVPTLDELCQSPSSSMVHLNHTIVNGTINGICSDGPERLHISLDANDDGYFTIDIPKDVFNNMHLFGCDRSFGIDVYSEQTTLDVIHTTDRKYIPTNMADNCFRTLGHHVCESYVTVEECFEFLTKERFINWHGHAGPLMATKVESADTFDRYKFPFLAGDALFSIAPEIPRSWSTHLLHHYPEKYTVPQGKSSDMHEKQGRENQNARHSCDSEFVPIAKPGGAIACVKPSTFDNLIQRGWSPHLSSEGQGMQESGTKSADQSDKAHPKEKTEGLELFMNKAVYKRGGDAYYVVRNNYEHTLTFGSDPFHKIYQDDVPVYNFGAQRVVPVHAGGIYMDYFSTGFLPPGEYIMKVRGCWVNSVSSQSTSENSSSGEYVCKYPTANFTIVR